jgi:hypothetical protein
MCVYLGDLYFIDGGLVMCDVITSMCSCLCAYTQTWWVGVTSALDESSASIFREEDFFSFLLFLLSFQRNGRIVS